MSQGDLSGGPDPRAPSLSALLESLINPLQERIEDWKKSANQLDKDHAKGGARVGARPPAPYSAERPSQCSSLSLPAEYKRARHEIKKKSSDTLKLQKKARKGRAQSTHRGTAPWGPPRYPPLSSGVPRASSWLEGPYPGHRTLQPVGWGRGSTLHPRPDPGPLLRGRQQEAQQAPAPPGSPTPTPGVALSIRLSFTHSFFLSLFSFSQSFL